jgi:hypothetical protein
LNSEQLNSARLARWSQNGEARLTQEAAAEWLGTVGFCSYLPAAANHAAPTASFLEAVVGRPAQFPSAGERSRALELLARLIENSSAVPLKLGNSLGEQPDFVASEEALRYIYALRGDRKFKNGPSTAGNEKVTTLAQHCWQAIEQNGPLTVEEMQPILGRDITEAAVARALQELWTGLYVFPIVRANGAPAKWELLSRRFPEQVAAGSSTGQAEAQSAMVSLYLHAAVAAMEEDILAVLSPLASQSKLREVVRALGSMRQLDIIDIGGRSHVCLQGGLLPEMVTQLSEEQLAASPMRPEIEIEAAPEEAKKFEPKKFVPKKFVPKKFVPKKFVPKTFKPGKFAAGGASAEDEAPKRFAIRASADGRDPGTGGFSRGRSSSPLGDRPPSRPGFGPARPSRFSGERSGTGARPEREERSPGDYPPRRRAEASDASGARKKPYASSDQAATRGPGERARRWEKSGEAAGDRDKKSFTHRSPGPRPSGFHKPTGVKKVGGFKKPWASKGADARGGASFGEGAKKPWTARPGGGAGGARFAGPRRGGDRPDGVRPKRWEKPGAGDPSGARPRKPYASAGKPSGSLGSGFKATGPRSAERRSFGPKSFGAKPDGGRPWASKGAASRVGSARSYAARTGQDASPRSGGKSYGKSASARAGAKPWTKRAPATSGEGGDRAKPRERMDASAGERGAKPFWAKNPRGGKGSAAAGRSNRPKAGKRPGKRK